MKPHIEEFLRQLARQAGGELEFMNGLPVRFYGGLLTDSPIVIINHDQPSSEVIFTILHEIAHLQLHCGQKFEIKVPWYLNHPYENEVAGEIAYKTKRVLRQSFAREWQADIWALCAFCEIGCPDEFLDFLKHHPEKWKFMLIVIPAIWKGRLVGKFKKFLSAFKTMPETL